MHQSFGARLRQHREQRNISLQSISDQTKIKLSLLEGLERDDISHWPSGVFRRAYVRAYAHAIGLNPDVVIKEFFDVHPEPRELIESPPPPQPRLRSLVGSALGSLSRLRGTSGSAPQRPAQTFALNVPVRSEPEDLPALAANEPVAAVAPPESRDLPPEGGSHESGSGGGDASDTDAGLGSARVASGFSRKVHEDAADVDLLAAAHLCTELGRVEDSAQLQSLLVEAARILDARGVIVWVWDYLAAELRPALVHGYSEKVRSQLPGVRQDDDNVTASAFRLARTCVVGGTDDTSGALAVPLLTPAGAVGVFAVELPAGREQSDGIRAVATFLAAVLAQLIGGAPAEESAEARRLSG